MMWGGWGRKGPEKGGARKGKGQNREPQQGIQEKKGPEKGEHKQFHAKSEPLPPQASFQKAFLDDIALCSELFQQLFLPPLTRSVTYEHTVFSLVLFSLWA